MVFLGFVLLVFFPPKNVKIEIDHLVISWIISPVGMFISTM